jgi:hypothetical protein
MLLAVAACASATAAPAAPAGPTPECDAATAFAIDGAPFFTDLVGQRLWRGTCSGPHELLVAYPDAWFASNVPVAGGILYTRASGVWRYDFATRDNTLVNATPHGVDDDCMQISTSFHGELFDRVARLADNGTTLVVERRGAGCHQPASWEVWITDWREPARAVAHVAHPIHDLAAAGNLVYFADSAGVWTIRDGGPPVRVPTEGVAVRTGADRRRRRRDRAAHRRVRARLGEPAARRRRGDVSDDGSRRALARGHRREASAGARRARDHAVRRVRGDRVRPLRDARPRARAGDAGARQAAPRRPVLSAACRQGMP